MKTKSFTLDEAQALLPVVESLMRSAIEAKQRVEQIEEEFKKTSRDVSLRGGMALDIVGLARRRAESDKALQRAKDAIAEIHAAGAQVKDLNMGLVDFPCRVDSTTVLLCWKMGEPRITHWHGTGEGFAGRKPINDRIARAGKIRRGN